MFPPSCIDMREKDSARGQLGKEGGIFICLFCNFLFYFIFFLDGFGELLLAPSMTLPLALLSKMYSCESMDHPTIEKVTFSIVSLFQNHGTGDFCFSVGFVFYSVSELLFFLLVMSLLYSVSQQEVDQTLSLQTLFRQNRFSFLT